MEERTLLNKLCSYFSVSCKQVYGVFNNSTLTPSSNRLPIKMASGCIVFGGFLWHPSPEILRINPWLVKFGDNESENENSMTFAPLKFILVGFTKRFLWKG